MRNRDKYDVWASIITTSVNTSIKPMISVTSLLLASHHFPYTTFLHAIASFALYFIKCTRLIFTPYKHLIVSSHCTSQNHTVGLRHFPLHREPAVSRGSQVRFEDLCVGDFLQTTQSVPVSPLHLLCCTLVYYSLYSALFLQITSLSRFHGTIKPPLNCMLHKQISPNRIHLIC